MSVPKKNSGWRPAADMGIVAAMSSGRRAIANDGLMLPSVRCRVGARVMWMAGEITDPGPGASATSQAEVSSGRLPPTAGA